MTTFPGPQQQSPGTDSRVLVIATLLETGHMGMHKQASPDTAALAAKIQCLRRD